MNWNEIKFANPEFFFLFILIPLFMLWYIFRNNKSKSYLKISSIQPLVGLNQSWKVKFAFIPFLFRLLAISALIFVLARPQSTSSKKSIKSEGIDIVLALDISTSMLAEDFKPNRLEAAKKTAIEFIKERVDDRIGLVVFAGESFTQCPVTIDHDVLINLFQNIKTGTIQDGTAIGMGLATAISRLKESKAKSKVIILLTDGVNNTGMIDPVSASDIAKTFGIRVYTIGVGKNGTAPFPIKTNYGTQYQQMEVQIDENLMRQISSLTNGKYFRATNNKALQNIYKQIDSMEKTLIDVAYFSKYSEQYLPFAILGLIFFITELLLRYLIFRKIP